MELLKIRTVTESDFFETETITREAFWDLYQPGCDEHLILHNIRESDCYIRELDLVAIFENKIIGHIVSTKAKVIDSKNIEHEVLCVGPISVFPQFQNIGIGTKLVKESIAKAKNMGYAGMILFGDPQYYHRFGFKNAKLFGIKTKEGKNMEPFMALPLFDEGLKDKRGHFYEDPVFKIKKFELVEFEAKFPPKEKHITRAQFR